MARPTGKVWVVFGGIATVLGIMVALQSLGLAPWSFAKAADLDKTAGRIDALELKFEKIDGKLDTIIELYSQRKDDK